LPPSLSSTKEKLNLPLIPTQRRIRTYRRAGGGASGDSTKTRLPTIAVYAYEADRESIPSHRSTRSEPVQGTKMIYTPDRRPPSHHETTRTSHRTLLNQQSNSYNASGVLDVLRLQKQEENKRSRPDFSGMWKWKNQEEQKSEEAFVIEQPPPQQQQSMKQSTKSSQIGQKVNQVKKMHELYRQNVETSSNGPSLTSNPSPSPRANNTMQLSPIRYRSHVHSPYQKPQTPVVRDKVLSTDDYHTVSKYFKLHSPASHQLSSYPPPSPYLPASLPAIAPLPSPDHHHQSTSVPQFKEVINDLDTSTSSDVDQREDDPFALSADNSLLRPNSPDGLLNWCATLDTDILDDLY
jgi:hypothetical protein